MGLTDGFKIKFSYSINVTPSFKVALSIETQMCHLLGFQRINES